MSIRSSGALTSNSGRRPSWSSQLSQSPRKNAAQKAEIAYFNEVLAEAGVTLISDETPNIVTQEQALVTRDINKTLQSHITYPTNAQEFMTGLKLLCHKEASLRKALLPTELRKGEDALLSDNSEPKIEQECLMKLLLNVNCLQGEVIGMLLEQVTNCATEVTNDTTWLRLLLNPLRYLSQINDSKTLTTKLVDILEIATYTAQLEILNLIPEIIPDNESEETAQQLSNLLEDHADLTGAIIDCLNFLNISLEVRNNIQQQILLNFESTASSKIFPILFEFLITDCSTKDLPTVLINARDAADKIMGQEVGDKEADSNKVVVFNRLSFFAVAQKDICEGWINAISNVRSNADHKPVDLLILFMLHSVASSRKRAIEGLIRKRVKAGMFKMSLLEALFKKKYFVSQILKDYLNSILEIAASCLRFYNDFMLVEFASMLYKLLFGHELVDRLQRQDIIYNLMLLTSTSDKKSVTPPLNVLISLRDDFVKLQQHTMQLMGLLEKLDGISLRDTKLIFDLLCSLTCGEKADDSMSGLRDEIHMIIRKQMSSAKQILKHRGIIAAVVMAKTLATTSEEQNESLSEDSMTIGDLPQGGPQDAAGLLELANICTLGSPESVALYNDQLAFMLITANSLSNHFMVWLYQQITNDFQTIFVIEAVPQPINDIHVSMQYSLNTDEEVDSPIAVNIAGLTLKSQFFENSSILTLSPLFRLLRLVHYKQHDGDLATVDALLGCAVIMPDLEDIDTYDTEQLKQVTDCLFHCINWFRELISAFVTQKSRKLRSKVLQRLTGLVQLEELLQKCLEKIPDYQLPLSYYDTQPQNIKQQLSPSKPSKVARPRKKQKISDTMVNPNETVASTSAATQPTRVTATKKKKDSNMERDISFREIDTDIILLLRYPLKIGSDSDISQSQIVAPSQMTTLDIGQFKFLMKDFAQKLSALTKGKDLGLSLVNVVNSTDLITDCIRLLPSIKKHLKTVESNLEELLKQTDGCLDSEQMFTSEANNLNACFALVMQSYALIFGWSGFQHTKNLHLLKDCLRALQDEQQSQLVSVKGLITGFTSKLVANVEHCLTLAAAVHVVEIMQALYLLNAHPELKRRIAVVSGKLLTKRWYSSSGELDGGKNSFINIDKLVKAYLGNANVKTLCGLVGTLQEQVSELKTKDDCLGMLTSINKANFHIFYRCLCVALLESVRAEVISLTNNQHLVLWRTTVLTMQGLMTVVKAQEIKTNLLNFLKNSIGILKVFLSSGIPVLEIMLRSKTDEVVEIFKIMQTSTRFLHHLCCYSKFTKDTSLVAYVPQFRHVLESLLYRVKAALVGNGCSEAFWMGTLRNRDIHGEDILSQSTIATDQSSDTEEVMPDETDQEADVADPSNADSDAESSISEMF